MSRRKKTSCILQILRVQKYIIFGKLYESGNRENIPYNLATWLRLIQFIFLFSKHTLSAERKLYGNLNFVRFQFCLLFYKLFNRGLHGIVLTGRQKKIMSNFILIMNIFNGNVLLARHLINYRYIEIFHL